MKKSIYTVLDEKAQTIYPLYLGVSDSEAERTIAAAVGSDSLIARYPHDFALLRLGDVDTSTGAITPHAVPVLVCKADELLASNKGE